MLALAPIAAGDPPLDAGERHGLDVLLDLSCVLRAADGAEGDLPRLRVERGRSAALSARQLAAGEWLRIADGDVVVERAALALVRDLASAVAEQRSLRTDQHGRVPSSENALVLEGDALEREPVVSRAAGMLADAVRLAAGARPAAFVVPWPEGRRWAAALTHDLDVVEWWPAFTALRLAELVRKGEVGTAVRVVGAAVASGGRDVVWRAVRQVLETEAALGVRSSWYILCGSPTLATARAGDLTYRPESPAARRILEAVRAAGHEIGLHGSFATAADGALFVNQRRRLAELAGPPATGVRQHYLRMHPARTPAAMRAAGFGYDSTHGFPDRNGFRLGVADVVPLWSDPHEEVLPIDEAPFCWMDRALSKYRGVEDPAAWIDDALELAARCQAVQGMFVGIWHPNLAPALGFPRAPEAYRRLVSELLARGAHVAPLGELVAWRRSRRAVRGAALGADGRVRLTGPAPGALRLESAAGHPLAIDGTR